MNGSKRPNILLIVADQLGGPALPFDGTGFAKAPHLQRLAEHGVVFENAYCNFPICAPSRASMLAGLLPHSFGLYDNSSEFRADIPTVNHYLRQLGYRSVLSGKMHFIGPDQEHGYDSRLTTEIYPANFAWTVDWSKGRGFRPTNLTMSPVIEAGQCVRSLQIDYDDEVEYASLQGLYDLARDQSGSPFFLTVSFTHPHSPYVTTREYWDRYRHEDVKMPDVGEIPLEQKDHLSRNLHYCQGRDEYQVSEEQVRNARHAYFGMISYIDDKVGRLLEVLRQTGLDDNTVVIFTSDHGDMMGERGMWYKQHFFEWACRVPLVVSWPDRYKPARVQCEVSLVDLMPTLLDVATDGKGFSGVVESDGHSLFPIVANQDVDWDHPVISEFSADGSTGPSRMVLKDRQKYMYLEGVEECLVDLDADPLELENQIDNPAYADRIASLRDLAFRDWNPEATRERIAADQKRRLFIHRVTQGDPTYVHALSEDDKHKYVRNAGAADTKARARFPYVEPSWPPQLSDH
ncbi:MAG: choline-sulfatase [Proteobacteria bacterium]|nr:MAG: choline-sulfatase [Pseudomonadota bacterium]